MTAEQLQQQYEREKGIKWHEDLFDYTGWLESKMGDISADEKNKNPKQILLTDLIDVIHYTIIKHRGENIVALKEIQALEYLIKGSNKLENYDVTETELWCSLMNDKK